MKTAPRSDIYERVTSRIVEQLEQGVRPWTKPWSTGQAAGRVAVPLRANGKPYRGVNVLILWMEAMANAYAASLWMTYRQATELGGQVRKGEKGTMVVFSALLVGELAGNRVTQSGLVSQGHVKQQKIDI